MPDARKPQRDAIAALLDLSVESPLAPDEAETDLRAAGVDVDGFLVRVRARLTREADEERLRWLTEARRDIAIETERPIPKQYLEMSHADLAERVRKRQAQAGQSAYHHKLEELTDDDLRTLLMDFDELDDAEDEK